METRDKSANQRGDNEKGDEWATENRAVIKGNQA
jgi:hypothetical protein